MMMNKGTGAIRDKKDKRDFKYASHVVAMGIQPFDWEKGYDIESVIGKKLEVKDQGSSGSCGGQAWGYYGQALDDDHDQKSAKFIYSQTFVKPAGSAGRTNCDLVIKKGWGTEALTPSYNNGLPPTEEFMQSPQDITPEAYKQALTDRGLSYANVEITIDDIAVAIRENKGCILGIDGKNNGTWMSKYPTPPDKIDKDTWSHWIYAGKVLTKKGKKYIGFINSWGDDCGDHGWQYISEDYLKYPFVWSCWTMVYNYNKFVFTKFLKYGSRGDEVKQLQIKLGGLTVDGIFGNKTRLAVIAFQIKNLLVPDGLVGPKTRAALNK